MRELVIKSGRSGTVRLVSNTRLILQENAEISASDKIEDFIADDSIFNDPCGNEFGRSLFYAREAENIEIVGLGNCVLNGRGRTWINSDDYYRRPSVIRFVDCKNVRLKNFTLYDSPCWAIHLHNCENVEIEDVRIESKWSSNNDGIDLDGCRNVRVTNCTVDTGDDAVVLKNTKNVLSKNITIEHCTLTTLGAGFKIGTESVGDFEGIVFRNNTIVKANGCAIKIVPTDGANVRNVLIENVEAQCVTGPVFIANGERMRMYYAGEKRENYGGVSSVTIRGMNANVFVREDMPAAKGKGCVFVSGTKRNPVKDIRIEDCEFTMPGGVTEQRAFSVEEMGAQYPEYYSLGTAPAYGAYLRNIENGNIKNVSFHCLRKDVRRDIIMENVNGFTLER